MDLHTQEAVIAPHLSADEVAGYVDHLLPEADHSRVEQHLATCAECRSEYRAVKQLVRSAPRRWRGSFVALAAAAAIVFVVWTGVRVVPAPDHRVREPGSAASGAPLPRQPVGPVAARVPLAWGAAAGAINYRVTVFDTVGRALLDAETPDTVQIVPDSVRLSPGTPYYWKVEAQTDWGRWTPSPLTRFVIAPAP